MWKTLRTDLTEFVSTVAGDTTEALNRIDDNFPDAEEADADNNDNDDDDKEDLDADKSGEEEEDEDEDDLAAEMEECVRRMKIKETFTTPLLPEKPAAAAKEEGSSGDEAEDEKDDKEEEEEEEEQGVSDDDDDDDDDDDEDPQAEEKEIRAFLDSFSLDAKTDEIASLLEAHPDTLKVSFEELVPSEVTYEEFWQRYFYRCDPERVAAEWAADEERAAANRNQAVSLGLTAVSNFLGGAVQAVSASLAEDDTGASNPNAQRRPPFVMSADSGDEDEEEVELGWDDDDDDDEDEGGSRDKEQNTMQIEFKDLATEKLQEQLRTAIEERDLLHQTVEMQTKEISALKAAAPSEDAAPDAVTTSSNDDEVKKLKHELFEKESELAALRASLLDTSGSVESPHHAALEQEVKRLSVQLNESEARATEAASLLENAKAELEQTVLQTKQVEGKLAQVNEEKSKLEASLQSQKSEMEALQSKLQQSEDRANRLEKELQAVQEQLSGHMQQQQPATAVVEGESVDSPVTQDTVTSAVKVESPAAVEEASTEDGWDDDW